MDKTCCPIVDKLKAFLCCCSLALYVSRHIAHCFKGATLNLMLMKPIRAAKNLLSQCKQSLWNQPKFHLPALRVHRCTAAKQIVSASCYKVNTRDSFLLLHLLPDISYCPFKNTNCIRTIIKFVTLEHHEIKS